jgi:hypothetical protein
MVSTNMLLQATSNNQRQRINRCFGRWGRDLIRIIVSIAILSLSSLSMAAPPLVHIKYNKMFDAVCALVKGYEIEDSWKDELAGRIEEFRSTWDAIGPQLLSETERLSGYKFDDSISAYLSLCSVPSQSLVGISINMRYALASFTSEPVSFEYKAAVIYHEILHQLIAERVPVNSRLLEFHKDEHERVQNHLHLLALEKAVYLRLGLGGELTEVINIDGKLTGGFYKRAWEIINANEETYKLYVAEIGR